MPFGQINNDRLSDKIVMNIVEQIRLGELKPGDKLPPETRLTEIYGVSRGILREALTALRSSGYIRRRPRDGTYINEPPYSDDMYGSVSELLKIGGYADLIELRECMELRAVVKAIETAEDEEIEELIEQLELGEDGDHSGDIDHYFHYRLAELSGNQLFMRLINLYYDIIAEIAAISRQKIHRRDAIKEEHLAIAKALRERDADKAKEAVILHLTNIANVVRGDKFVKN